MNWIYLEKSVRYCYGFLQNESARDILPLTDENNLSFWIATHKGTL